MESKQESAIVVYMTEARHVSVRGLRADGGAHNGRS